MTTKRWWPRIRMRGLAFKVTALVFGAVFLSVTVNAVMLFLREQREELKDLQAHATAMAQLVAANSEYAVYTGSSDGLQSLVQRLDDMDEIAYVRILRLAGDTVMDRRLNAASAGATLLGVDPSHVVRRLRIGGDDVLDIAVPIVTRPRATATPGAIGLRADGRVPPPDAGLRAAVAQADHPCDTRIPRTGHACGPLPHAQGYRPNARARESGGRRRGRTFRGVA